MKLKHSEIEHDFIHQTSVTKCFLGGGLCVAFCLVFIFERLGLVFSGMVDDKTNMSFLRYSLNLKSLMFYDLNTNCVKLPSVLKENFKKKIQW